MMCISQTLISSSINCFDFTFIIYICDMLNPGGKNFYYQFSLSITDPNRLSHFYFQSSRKLCKWMRDFQRTYSGCLSKYGVKTYWQTNIWRKCRHRIMEWKQLQMCVSIPRRMVLIVDFIKSTQISSYWRRKRFIPRHFHMPLFLCRR